jgi:two-component system CheB/CheR fusion protein
MLVTEWNAVAEDLWGLRADEVRQQPFFNLEIGLPVDTIKPVIKKCLEQGATHADITVPAVDRRGSPIEMKVTCAPLQGAGGNTEGVILFMEPTPVQSAPKR